MSFDLKAKDDHFSSILMELTMQYAELTDAHTFLLIETPTVRKFAGKQHLKDLYKRGELKPCGKDSEITVDPNLTQMIELKSDDEEMGEKEEKDEKESLSEMGSLPRRHIGELPSERRLRLRNERKTYNKFVNMSYKTEDSFGTFLMEALMKYSCMNDTNIFFLIETNHGRRFAGKANLCDQYLEGVLRASDDDLEMGLDKSIKVVTERRIAKPKDENEADASSEKCKEEEDGEEKNEGSERKRKESDASLDSSDKSVKRRQPHVGLLPSERREKAKQEREAKLAAENPAAAAPPPPPPPQQAMEVGSDGRKHRGELPSERRDRLRREREAADFQNKYTESKMQSGPGYICGPSNFPSNYGDASMMAGYGDGSYGWGNASASGYDAAFAAAAAANYADNGYGYKSSYGNWKSGGTMQTGPKSSKSQFGW